MWLDFKWNILGLKSSPTLPMFIFYGSRSSSLVVLQLLYSVCVEYIYIFRARPNTQVQWRRKLNIEQTVHPRCPRTTTLFFSVPCPKVGLNSVGKYPIISSCFISLFPLCPMFYLFLGNVCVFVYCVSCRRSLSRLLCLDFLPRQLLVGVRGFGYGTYIQC